MELCFLLKKENKMKKIRLGQAKEDGYYISIDKYNYCIVEELMDEYLKEYKVKFKDIKHYLRYSIECREESTIIGNKYTKCMYSEYILVVYFLNTKQRFQLFHQGNDSSEIGAIHMNLIDFLKETDQW
jgi:hypothetical protein